MNRRRSFVALALAGSAVAAVATPGLASAAPSPSADAAWRLVKGQIIVHKDTQQTHVIPSPKGDPNTYLQLTLFQDFTGDFTGHGTAVFFATVHHDGKYPNGTITFTGREAEYGTIFKHTGAFYFKDSHGLITPDGKVSGVFTSDGGQFGLSGIDARGTFFPTAHPSSNGNLAHTTDYSFRVRFVR